MSNLRASIKIVECMEKGPNHTVKKLVRGLDLSEDNLTAAGVVATGGLLKSISHLNFKSYLKGVYKDANLEVFLLIFIKNLKI